MLSCVNITNLTVLDNTAMFLNPFPFDISYQSLLPLKYDLEWKLIYMGCAEDERYDQVLQTVHVGPVKVGNYRFVLQADPPELELIWSEDLLGVVTIVLSSYRRSLSRSPLKLGPLIRFRGLHWLPSLRLTDFLFLFKSSLLLNTIRTLEKEDVNERIVVM